MPVQHFVDGNAAGGNGSSWAAAWKTLGAITGVSAGDTVFISGGSSGQTITYATGGGWTPAGGTRANPITYQIGQDAAHNGTAHFSGTGFLSGNMSGVVVTGDAGDGLQHFTVAAIATNNSAIAFDNTNWLRVSYVDFGQQPGALAFANPGNSLQIDHCNFIQQNITPTNSVLSWNDGSWSTRPFDDSVFAYNTIQAPFASNQDGWGNDFFGSSFYGGLTVHHCSFIAYPVSSYPNGQHQDGMQMSASINQKVYDNYFQNITNYPFYGDASNVTNGFVNLFIFNNIIALTNSTVQNFNSPAGIAIGSESAGSVEKNITVANNLVADYTFHIAISVGDGGSQPWVNQGGLGVYNNIATFNTAGTAFRTGSAGNGTIANVANVNLNSTANFVSYIQNRADISDFHLVSTAAALRGQGTNLSSQATLCPEIMFDRDGVARPASGAWDIGPYQFTGAAAPAPSVPTGLVVGTITSTTITLSWTTSTDAPNSNASLTYNLERKTGAGAFSTIKTGIAGVASGTITYTDSSLTASTLYTYNVQAQNPGGLTSAFTTTNASGTTTAAAPAPSVPTGLSAVALTSSSISLSWTTSTDPPDTNASLTYKLQRKLGAGAFATLPAVVPGVASGTVSFTDTGLAPSSLYTYNVQCVNQEGLSSAFTTTNASATTSAGPAVAFVQITDSGAPTGTATTTTATYALAQGAGHTNIVVVNIGNASSATLGLTISSVVDTVNGAYTAAPPGLVAMSVGTLSQGSQVFYRSNISAAAAGGNTVTVTASAAASFFEIAVLEYSGIATTSPIDVSVSAAVNGSGATVNATSGTVSTFNSNDLLLGAFSFFDAPAAAGTGYSARNTPPPYTLYVEDQLVTATGSYAGTATAVAGGGGWTAQLIAFKAAPAGSPTTLTDSVALIPGTKVAPVSRDTHRGKPSLIPGSLISVLSRDSHRESVVLFPGSLLTLIPSTGGTITLPDVAAIFAGTALSFNARRTHRALAGVTPGIVPILNPTLNGIIQPQVVQVNSATPSSVSTINCTYVQAQNRGDLNVVIVGWTNATSLTVNSVTDTVNGAYTLGVPLATIGTVQQAMYFLPDILPASAGTNIVTVVLSGVATRPDVRILEYSGIVTSLPIDATGSNTGNNSSPSVSVVSLNSDDLVVTGGTSISNFLSAGPLFTNRLLTADKNIADDAVFVLVQAGSAIHWEDPAWHWEDSHFWEGGTSAQTAIHWEDPAWHWEDSHFWEGGTSAQTAIHWEDPAWHWEDSHFWEQ